MINKIKMIGKKCLIACLISTVVVIGGGLDCGRVEAESPSEAYYICVDSILYELCNDGTAIVDGLDYIYPNDDFIIPDTVQSSTTKEYKVTKIKNEAFAGQNLSGSLIIGKNVQIIGESAFQGNQFSGTLNIPNSVTSIGNNAFDTSEFDDIGNDVAKLVNGTRMSCSTGVVKIGESLLLSELNILVDNICIYSGSDCVEYNSEEGSLKGLKDGVAIVFCKDSTTNVVIKYIVTVGEKQTTTTASGVKKDTTSRNYIVPQWVPTSPEDIFRFSLRGKEDVFYNVLETEDTIQMTKEIQGPLFFDAVALVQGDYKLARTYTILVNNSLVYKTEKNTKITLQIPQEIQKEGRTFRIFGVTENGKNFVLEDLDKDPATITFETNQFYAFAMGYLD